MSGFLFLLAIDWIMQETTNLAKTGIRWKFTSQLEDLDYADDIALISTNHGQMQKKTDKLTEAAQRVGLNISKSKTRILKINCKKNNSIKCQNGQDIHETNEFTYLGACVSADGGADKDIERRLCKAKTTFRKLRKVWSYKQYSKKTKIKLFNTLVKPVILYGSETWKANAKDYEKLDSFQYQCLKRIQGIFWPYIISKEELQRETGSAPMSREVRRRRWKFLGHVLRMPQDHHCVIALTWSPDSKRKVATPKTTWRRSIEKERSEAGWKSWEEARIIARDRDRWKRSIKALCATEHEED